MTGTFWTDCSDADFSAAVRAGKVIIVAATGW